LHRTIQGNLAGFVSIEPEVKGFPESVTCLGNAWTDYVGYVTCNWIFRLLVILLRISKE
jgi:hypothetical protein